MRLFTNLRVKRQLHPSCPNQLSGVTMQSVWYTDFHHTIQRAHRCSLFQKGHKQALDDRSQPKLLVRILHLLSACATLPDFGLIYRTLQRPLQCHE